MQRSFKRDLSSLEPLFEFTGDFAKAHRLDEPVVFAMNLAIEELFTNMVKYGGGDDTVFIALDVLSDDLVIELFHSGAREFDPSDAKPVDRNQPLENREPGGLGLQLVRSVMDHVAFEHKNGGARVTLSKRLRGA
jgi:anti-sigma regulatory factor (Ser/Thr protein kinase)